MPLAALSDHPRRELMTNGGSDALAQHGVATRTERHHQQNDERPAAAKVACLAKIFPIRGDRLFRKRFAIGLSPGAISRYRLHGRPPAGPARTWPSRLGFCHAGAGLCFQATAHVNDLIVHLLVRDGS